MHGRKKNNFLPIRFTYPANGLGNGRLDGSAIYLQEICLILRADGIMLLKTLTANVPVKMINLTHAFTNP